jgi:predicted RNase H-like nuclease (RuvC/YqgF family)
MENVSVIISGIDFKLRKLIEQHKKIRQSNAELTAKVEEQDRIINQQKQLIDQLQERIKTVNIAKTLASRFEITDAKKKIGDMVREIDKCINLLNK